jgi:hypothetical protein
MVNGSAVCYCDTRPGGMHARHDAKMIKLNKVPILHVGAENNNPTVFLRVIRGD